MATLPTARPGMSGRFTAVSTRRSQGNAVQTGGIGLLAGLGAGLGIVVPYRRRVTTSLPDLGGRGHHGG